MEFKDIFAAKVVKIERHPNADRLRLITLDLGDREVSPVVCGAWNFEVGDVVALALPGAHIPQNIHSEAHEPFTLERATIRGIESQGMICAAFELGLGPDEGPKILILKKDSKIGSNFETSMIDEQNHGQLIKIFSQEEVRLKEALKKKTDAESERIKRYLAMPDLSRTEGSPLKHIIDKVRETPTFKNFDVIDIPEIVPVDVSFDKFNFAADHPARSRSDTYYVDDKNILRTHDTVMWYYYLTDESVKKRIANGETISVLCYGKVYRKDEIDRFHMNIFHQMGGLLLAPDDKKQLTLEDLKAALTEIVQHLFGKDIEYRFNVDTFPYTDPSLEVEINLNGKWVEILGSGMPKKEVLANFGLNGYNGWAFGFGLERLAILSMELPDIRLLWSTDPRVVKQLHLGQKFVEVSKYPPIPRDISFIVSKDFVPNNYFDLIRDIGGGLVEQVELIDKYENAEKFGPDRISYTYRVIYRSPDRTLRTEEVEPLQNELYEQTKTQFSAELR